MPYGRTGVYQMQAAAPDQRARSGRPPRERTPVVGDAWFCSSIFYDLLLHGAHTPRAALASLPFTYLPQLIEPPFLAKVMEHFPIPAPAFNGGSRSVEPGCILKYFNWLRQGWAIFIVNPGVWMAMMVLLIVIYLGDLALVPLDRMRGSPLASHLLTPLLAAGMLLACQKVAREEKRRINDLFTGFQRHTGAW
jgi:hypothetical protein